jgi:hypothetical protein
MLAQTFLLAKRIDAIFDMERDINGRSIDERSTSSGSISSCSRIRERPAKLAA